MINKIYQKKYIKGINQNKQLNEYMKRNILE